MSVSALIIIVLFSMFALSIYFWYLEALPVIKLYKSKSDILAPIDTNNPITNLVNMTFNVLKLIYLFLQMIPASIPLVIDISITMALTTVLSLGGNIGGAAGLFASNIISIIILLISRKEE